LTPPAWIPSAKRDLWLRLFGTTDPKLIAKWKRYHENNPWVYAEFLKVARELRADGFGECSAWLIINQIRWIVARKTKGDTFKISNDYVAIYARMAIWHFPDEFEHFFTIKKMKEERGVWREPASDI
jgi:hypothetical protein